MPDVASGIEIDGESAGSDSDAAFDAALSAAVEKGNTPTEPESGEPIDPSTQTAEAIKAELRASVTEPSGFDFGDKRPEINPEHLALGERLNAQESERAQQERDELAALRFLRVWDHEDSTDEIRLAAAVRLSEESPTKYQDLVQSLDERWSDDAALYDPEGLLEDDDPTGWALDQQVTRAQAEVRAAVARDVVASLQKTKIEGQSNALIQAYEARGLKGQQLIGQLHEDLALMREHGFDLDSMSPEQMETAVQEMHAGRVVAGRLDRIAAFKQSLVAEETGTVSEGLETMTPWGPMKSAPQPIVRTWENDLASFDREVQTELARGRGKPAGISAEEFKRQIVAPDVTDTRTGYTVNGRPADIDTASGAKERARLEREIARARDRAAY